MNNLLKSLCAVLALNALIFPVVADEPTIPANLWEQCRGGVAVALILKSRVEGGQQKNRLKVYIKNTSTAAKWLYLYDAASRLRVYYIGSSGTVVPLRNYTDHDANMDDVVDFNAGPSSIGANQTVEQSIEFTPEEWTIVTSHPIKCSFSISDQKASQGYKIETTPRMLTVEH